MNLENPDVDAGCDLDYVPNKAYVVPKDKPLEVIISDNLGFGGHNAALAFRRYAKK
jgi:3-oxoacyl-[acyl-carrier-protein] synthase II